MKRFALILAVVFVATACSSSATDTTQSTDTTATNSDTTQAQVGSESTSDSIGDDGASLTPDATIAPEGTTTPEGPEAPDFTMVLADGDSFTLSEESKPVYMVFWAEW